MKADDAAVRAFTAAYAEATGDRTPVQGAFAFGDSEGMADELAALVLTGPKRATAGAVVEFDHAGEALPEPGQLWVVHDGRGQPVCVIRTVEVVRGPLDEVADPAFAWDEGEGDRTFEWWRDGHHGYWQRTLPRIGATFTPDLAVVLERFQPVWPVGDRGMVIAEEGGMEVRELRWDERPWAAALLRRRHPDGSGGEDVTRLPMLVAVEGDDPVGLLTFRPRPGGVVDVVTLDVLDERPGVHRLLTAALHDLVHA